MSKLAHSCDETMAIIEARAALEAGEDIPEDFNLCAYQKAEKLSSSIMGKSRYGKNAENDPLAFHLLTELIYNGLKP